MRWSGLTTSLAALVVAAACGWTVGGATALPLGGNGWTAAMNAQSVQPAAHEHKEWYWNNGWWRRNPYTDHTIYGAYLSPPFPNNIFVPWRSDRLDRCAAKYPSFDAATGTYMTRSGHRRVCR